MQKKMQAETLATLERERERELQFKKRNNRYRKRQD